VRGVGEHSARTFFHPGIASLRRTHPGGAEAKLGQGTRRADRKNPNH
jgi:hypothetical protein